MSPGPLWASVATADADYARANDAETKSKTERVLALAAIGVAWPKLKAEYEARIKALEGLIAGTYYDERVPICVCADLDQAFCELAEGRVISRDMLPEAQ